MNAVSKLNRTLAGASVAALTVMAFTGFAAAGECPKDKVKDGAVTTGEMKPVGVTDTVIAQIDLSPKGPEFKGLMMRMRKLVIEPGGVVPWHDHKTRPANIYVVSGMIEEHRSTCEVTIMHKAGDVTAEFGANLAHWWKNTSKKQTVLISADIVPADMNTDKMM
jgi:quercetin dioxygenase-like cupin family protein